MEGKTWFVAFDFSQCDDLFCYNDDVYTGLYYDMVQLIANETNSAVTFRGYTDQVSLQYSLTSNENQIYIIPQVNTNDLYNKNGSEILSVYSRPILNINHNLFVKLNVQPKPTFNISQQINYIDYIILIISITILAIIYIIYLNNDRVFQKHIKNQKYNFIIFQKQLNNQSNFNPPIDNEKKYQTIEKDDYNNRNISADNDILSSLNTPQLEFSKSNQIIEDNDTNADKSNTNQNDITMCIQDVYWYILALYQIILYNKNINCDSSKLYYKSLEVGQYMIKIYFIFVILLNTFYSVGYNHKKLFLEPQVYNYKSNMSELILNDYNVCGSNDVVKYLNYINSIESKYRKSINYKNYGDESCNDYIAAPVDHFSQSQEYLPYLKINEMCDYYDTKQYLGKIKWSFIISEYIQHNLNPIIDKLNKTNEFEKLYKNYLNNKLLNCENRILENQIIQKIENVENRIDMKFDQGGFLGLMLILIIISVLCKYIQI